MSQYTSRSESDVGIRLRLGKQPRLCAVIKDRYSDFHVNEIDPDGNIVKLTSLTAPVDNSAAEALKDPQIITLIPEDVRQKIGDMQERLNAVVDKRNIKNDKECVEIKATDLEKESRTRIHRWISTFDKLSSETVDKDGDKFITIVAMKGGDRGKRRPANRAKYTHCVLYKEGVETSEAIGFIAKKLNMNPGFISYAGIKDKRAKTSQRLCISNIEASRLVSICKYRQNIKLGNFAYHPKPIALGDLKGNHFKLLLKNLRFSEGDEIENLGLNDVVTSAMESLASAGFINYYGMQRFGSYAVSTHQVGLEVLKQNWIKAYDLLLSPKPNDPSFLAKAKDLWLKERDPIGARSMLPSRFVTIESNLLHGLARSYARNDFVAVFLNMPRPQRLLYVHAYQSLMWNRVASFRVEEYGIDSPVVGDLVYVGEGEEEILEFEVNDALNDVREHSASDSKSAPKKLEVKTLTQEDINSAKYTIYDVLIPLYGSDVKFPENKTKDFLTKMLEDEGISSDCFERFRPIGDKPTGGYRKLLVRPTNVSHTLHTYSDSDNLDSYIKSDWEELNEASPSNGESARAKTDDSSTTTDSSTSKKTCLVLAFSLPSSSYATMALREIIMEQDKSCHRNDDANKISQIEPSTKQEQAHNDDPSEAEPSLKKPKVAE